MADGRNPSRLAPLSFQFRSILSPPCPCRCFSIQFVKSAQNRRHVFFPLFSALLELDSHTNTLLSLGTTPTSPPPPARAPPTSPDMLNGSSNYITNGTFDKDSSKNSLNNIVRRKLTGYVGFANLPNQWHRKSVRKGFNFNVMVVGISCFN
jgi:hypothetical protein